jgi:hypothetical protein
VTVSILISIVSWDGLAPVCAAFEIDVIGVGSSVDNVDINTLTRICGI